MTQTRVKRFLILHFMSMIRGSVRQRRISNGILIIAESHKDTLALEATPTTFIFNVLIFTKWYITILHIKEISKQILKFSVENSSF